MKPEPPPSVRAFLERVRAVDDPTPERRAGVHRAFQARLAALGLPALTSPRSFGGALGEATAGPVAPQLVRWLVVVTTLGGLGVAAVVLLGGQPPKAATPSVAVPAVQLHASVPASCDGDRIMNGAPEPQRDLATKEVTTDPMVKAPAVAVEPMSEPRVGRGPGAPTTSPRRPAASNGAKVIGSTPPAFVDRPRRAAALSVKPAARDDRSVEEEAGLDAPALNEPPTRNGTLAQEVKLIRAIRRAIGDRDPARARRLIAEHEARFADGVLREERIGLGVILLCAEGPTAAALEARARFLRRSPDSVIAPQVRMACGQTPRPGPDR